VRGRVSIFGGAEFSEDYGARAANLFEPPVTIIVTIFEPLVLIIVIIIIMAIIISIVALVATDYANFALGFFSGSKAQWPNANNITLFTRNEALYHTAISVWAMHDVIIGERGC
jgi:hypothetical protein